MYDFYFLNYFAYYKCKKRNGNESIRQYNNTKKYKNF
nr:MAG TPA: hypothetical protein [Caudoviricetes sp.]